MRYISYKAASSPQEYLSSFEDYSKKNDLSMGVVGVLGLLSTMYIGGKKKKGGGLIKDIVMGVSLLFIGAGIWGYMNNGHKIQEPFF